MKWFSEKGERCYSNECESIDGEIHMVHGNIAILVPGDSGIERLYNHFMEKFDPIYSTYNIYVAVEANSEEEGKYDVYDVNQFSVYQDIGIRHQDPVFNNVSSIWRIKTLLLDRHVPRDMTFSKDVRNYDFELMYAKESGCAFVLVCNHCFKMLMSDKEYYRQMHEGAIKPGTNVMCPDCGRTAIQRIFTYKEDNNGNDNNE